MSAATFPSDLTGQQAYIRAGGCGDAYPQDFRDFAAGHLAKPATDDMQLCTALAFLYTRWSCARYAVATERLERLGVAPERAK